MVRVHVTVRQCGGGPEVVVHVQHVGQQALGGLLLEIKLLRHHGIFRLCQNITFIFSLKYRLKYFVLFSILSYFHGYSLQFFIGLFFLSNFSSI